MVSAERIAGAPTPATAAPKLLVQQAHSTVCSSRNAHHPRSVSGRRPQQIGHRVRRPESMRPTNGATQHHVLVTHPRRRSVVTWLVVTAAVVVLYLALMEIFHWDTQAELFWFGLLVIVFAGAVIENAIRFDAITEQDASGQPKGAGSDAGPTFNAGLPA